MVIATCIVKLELSDIHSLKEKRSIVQSLKTRLPKQFNVAIAEVDAHDQWHSCVIAMVTVGTEAGYLHGLLEKAVAWIEQERPDVPLLDYQIEFR